MLNNHHETILMFAHSFYPQNNKLALNVQELQWFSGAVELEYLSTSFLFNNLIFTILLK